MHEYTKEFVEPEWCGSACNQGGLTVKPVAEAPVIERFTVDTPDQITLGQCVTLR